MNKFYLFLLLLLVVFGLSFFENAHAGCQWITSGPTSTGCLAGSGYDYITTDACYDHAYNNGEGPCQNPPNSCAKTDALCAPYSNACYSSTSYYCSGSSCSRSCSPDTIAGCATSCTAALTVAKAGTGAGTVSGASINCGSTCSASYTYNTAVTLTATPVANSTFAGWSGACSGTGVCNVTMTAAKAVTATFTLNPGINVNVNGWAWSSNIGWVSFNCANDSSACNGTNYGVSINDVSGNFSGYAWSSSVGWISFNRSDTGDPPGQPYKNGTILANYNSSTGAVDGWAKILSLGDNGWIKLRKFPADAGADYGVSINPATGYFSGWAWNANSDGSGIGWLSFNCSNDSPACGGSNYKVTADINRSPSATPLTAPNWSFSQASQFGALKAKLGWTFSDSDAGQSEYAYQIIVNTSNSIANPVFDSEQCLDYNNPSDKCIIDVGVDQFPIHSVMSLNYNTPYYWWVKVWDDHAAHKDSGYIQYNVAADTDNDDGVPLTFTTYKHKMPIASFTYFPDQPSRSEQVKFTDTSQVYLSSAPSTAVNCAPGLCTYLWSATAGASINDTATTSPIITFNSAGNSTVTLKVTDQDGYYISTSDIININSQLPKWKEVKPD